MNEQDDVNLQQNLKNLLGLQKIPSDTRMREILDEVDTAQLRPVFKKLFASAQRGKALEPFEFWKKDEKTYYLLALDGTGFFSSQTVHCEHCLVREHQNGTKTYQHQALGACIVHPNQSVVLPLAPEFICNHDGQHKNDCEREAAKRFLAKTRKDHPHLGFIVIEDALASNSKHIEELKKHDMRFILGAKRGDHEYLFTCVEEKIDWEQKVELEIHGRTVNAWFVNNVPLNKSSDIKINFIYTEEVINGKQTIFTWVTDIPINKKNLPLLVQGARTRWKIENETFNTLKNQGYHLEHNSGHGYHNLSNNFCMLTFLAFLFDQLQQLCCSVFQACRKLRHSNKSLWRRIRAILDIAVCENWTTFFLLLGRHKFNILNSS